MMVDLIGTVNCMDLLILLITVLTPEIIGFWECSYRAEVLGFEFFCRALVVFILGLQLTIFLCRSK